MTYIKKYGLRVIYTILSIIICLLLLTTLYYFNLLSSNIYQVLKIIIVLSNVFIGGYILGKNTQSKGYLEGIKLATILILFCLLISLISKNPLQLKVILYYLIISIAAVFGSMLGINKKTK